MTGTGDGAYGVPGAPEQVTVGAGIVSVTLAGTQVGTFSVSFSNNAGLQNPPDDVIVAAGDRRHRPDRSRDAGAVSRYDAQTGAIRGRLST